MSSSSLFVGLNHSRTIRIDDRLTVPAMADMFPGFADMPPVFATAFMVGFVEWTCVEAVRPYLAEDQQTVGVQVDMTHVAATPVELTVTARVVLVAIEGRKLRFEVSCRDNQDLIGEGFHERVIIDAQRFTAKLANKRERVLLGNLV